MSDQLWEFTTDETTQRTQIRFEAAELGEFDTMIGHVAAGVDTVSDLAEIMGKPKGTISKWVKRGLDSGRLRRDGNRILPGHA